MKNYSDIGMYLLSEQALHQQRKRMLDEFLKL